MAYIPEVSNEGALSSDVDSGTLPMLFSLHFPHLDSSYICVLTSSFCPHMDHAIKEEASSPSLYHLSWATQPISDISLTATWIGLDPMSSPEPVPGTTVMGALGWAKPRSHAINVRMGRNTMTHSPTRTILIGDGREWFLCRQGKVCYSCPSFWKGINKG